MPVALISSGDLTGWGTVALAMATVVLAAATRRSVSESRRARIDAQAPRLVAHSFFIEDTTSVLGENGFPTTTTESIHWDLTRSGNIPIGLIIRISLSNEGRTSAFVSSSDGLVGATAEFLDHEDGLPYPRELINIDGRKWTIVRPGEQCQVTLTYRQAGDSWKNEWLKNAPNPPHAKAFSFDIRNDEGSVRDRIRFSFGKYVLVPAVASDGWTLSTNDMSSTTDEPRPPAFCSCEVFPRKYPSRISWLNLRRKIVSS